jgi:26S proteasome regulatory subunit N2
LQDTQPEEAKSLIEEKLKKVTTEKAPVAGQTAGGSSGLGRGGLSSRDQQSILSQLGGGGASSINELFRQSARNGRQMGLDLGSSSTQAPFSFDSSRGAPHTPAPEYGGGAAAAAGVLTAVDEDNEGDEEAPVPGDFDYFSETDDE